MRKPSRRVVFGFLLFALIAAAILLSSNSGELWREARAWIVETRQVVDDNLLLAAAIYFAVYVAVTGLSLPSATAMSVIGGALFGRWLGTGLAIMACTIGATLAFWSSRYLFRAWVLRKFGHRLRWLNAGMVRDGPFFLLSLRLMAIFPFFVLNMVIALTPVRTRVHVWTTFLGMLPVTFLIANAGTAIASVDDPARVLSWEIVASLALLALVPQIVRKLVRRTRPLQETANASGA